MKKLLFLVFLSISSFAQNNDVESSKNFQNKLNKQFADSLASPLKEEDRKVFKGLDFFDIDEKYIVKAKFKKSKKEKSFKMKTTTDREPIYKKYGELTFFIDGKELVLSVYQNLDLIKKPGFKDHLFLPFTDLTCGDESYLGGRYLDMKIPKSKWISIDFNKAYNPYCVYNYNYSCPIVPSENHLDIEIKAGVKKFHD